MPEFAARMSGKEEQKAARSKKAAVLVSKSRRFLPYPSTTTDKTRNTVDRC
jgi:hypothetical protein